MRCIFCKSSTTDCKSEEHIIPESLGNVKHVLPPGWVCDDCNNYLSRKVEAPFLNSWYGRNSRFEMRVPSKRGKVPPATGLHARSRSRVDLHVEEEGGFSICPSPGEDEKHFVESVATHTHGTLYLPATELPPQNYETARFISKVAIEVLAHQCMDAPGWNDELVEKEELDELREYARRGRPGFVRPIHIRRIYPSDIIFSNKPFPPHEVLHEWGILSIPDKSGDKGSEYYAIIAIFGVEYTINLGGPELDGFQLWLKDNQNASYLYMEEGSTQQSATTTHKGHAPEPKR